MPARFILSDKNHLLILYKLLVDLLFIVLVFFVISLLAEGLIPGIITSHIGFSKIIFLAAFLILFCSYLARYLEISISKQKTNKKTLLALILILGLVVFNSLFKLDIFLNLSILTISLICGYLLFRVITEKGE